ncbi:Penicillin-insensitive transglycosylase & transpeptidase PBP-1C [hydrothermal vent metagenome]|uniref:peptidoglycan glycosyltransferase n=1 Tax=hydrothermal vent metagenome TaxID=652676 RepID=A0A3B0Z5Z4_9ZZZZ
MRATWQNLGSDRLISGASTLTMQVARLIDPHSRSFSGKLKQIFRALQLEWHYSKDGILTLYLNRAPFGGTLEGVQAAAFTYLGKSAAHLSDAEAALMAVLPQAPSRNRPDRHPDRAQAMRDKVLVRLAKHKVWSESRVEDAFKEPVWAQFYKPPLRAPLLSRRLVTEYPDQAVNRTTLDANLQMSIADLIRNRIQSMPLGTSAAVLVMENRNLAVRAYVGSADFSDAQRFGHVDMVQAMRSPGSTLKPFIYGMALDAGLIHSQSLLVDGLSDFGSYRPQNFDQEYSGPVSVSNALQRSLNVPAVQVLEKVGDNQFMSRLKSAGMALQLPRGAKANLALGLGGVGTTLESLVGVYSALVNGGKAGKPRFLKSEPLWQRPILSEGAAWIVRDILNSNKRPDRSAPYLMSYRGNQVAWKTGTSYGFRDSWTIGTTADYTVGVWIGRPDGTPLPGYYGAVAAAPLLFSITDYLPAIGDHGGYAPDSVSKAEICWPLGGLVTETPEALCHRKKEAYLIEGNVPTTFPDSENSWETNPVSFLVNPETGLRVDASCMVKQVEKRVVALWPKMIEAWVEPKYRRYQQISDFDPGCNKPPVIATGQVKIVGIQDGSTFKPVGKMHVRPSVELSALGGQGKHYWFINGEMKYMQSASSKLTHIFKKPGRYVITVVDEQGKSDEVIVEVSL